LLELHACSGFPASSSSGAPRIPYSRNTGFALVLVVGGYTVVHGPADQFLEKPGDLWGPPIHRRELESTPQGRDINYMEFWAGYKF
jgi:hypothetical protein